MMAVHNAVVMEQVAKMASIAFAANPHLTMNSFINRKAFSAANTAPMPIMDRK